MALSSKESQENRLVQANHLGRTSGIEDYVLTSPAAMHLLGRTPQIAQTSSFLPNSIQSPAFIVPQNQNFLQGQMGVPGLDPLRSHLLQPSALIGGGMIPQVFANPHDALFLSRAQAQAQAQASSQARMIGEAQAAMLQQQLLLSGSRGLLGQGQIGNNPVSMYNMPKLQALPASTATMSNIHDAPAPKSRQNALEALGSNLRSKSDPYIDVSEVEDPSSQDNSLRRTRGGVSEPFPEKLQRMLSEAEDNGMEEIVSFYSHGRAFGVHDIDRFTEEVMPKYFKQSKWNSFARQLNLYGFQRISTGPDAGGYYHELFLKGRPSLCLHMRRVGVPQGEDRRKYKAKNTVPDPDFYSMKPAVQVKTSSKETSLDISEDA